MIRPLQYFVWGLASETKTYCRTSTRGRGTEEKGGYEGMTLSKSPKGVHRKDCKTARSTRKCTILKGERGHT